MCQSLSITIENAGIVSDVTNSRATIRDVAARAGVSVATVSKVLNNRYGVAAATVARVREVIAELGYESSLIARSLRNHRTNVIGILVWAIEPFSAELLKGAERAMRDNDYELVVYSAGGIGPRDIGWENRYLSRLSGTLIDGAVLVTPTVSAPRSDVLVVAVDPRTDSEDGPTVSVDNFRGAQLATEHLVRLGHRRIAFLGRPPRDLKSSREREDGYRSALALAGIAFDPDLVRVAGYQEEVTRQAVRELLAQPDRPTAIFAANDLSALVAMDTAATLGIRVPDDLSVIGFDNVPESLMAEPSLTTIEQPLQLMGRRAVEMLVELLAGNEPDETHLRLPTRLIERASCSAPPEAVRPITAGGIRP